MTKSEIISLIKSRLDTDNSPNVYRRPLVRMAIVEAYCQSVYEQMYNELYRQEPDDIWKYVLDVEETISGDTDFSTGHTMPSIPVMLPRPNGGLFGFEGNDGSNYTITDYKRWKNAVDQSFDTAYMSGEYKVAIRGDKIYINETIDDGAVITYKMIPKFTSLGTTDQAFIPGGMEDHFIDRVLDTIFRPDINFKP